jgi:anti-anti-sigma factor
VGIDRLMIQITNHGSYSVFSLLFEEMDFVKTPKITEILKEKLEEISYSSIIMDLNNLYYIDSTGLSSLINVSRKISENNNEMVVVCNTTKILQLFDIAKVGSFFKIFDSMQNAEEYLASKET